MLRLDWFDPGHDLPTEGTYRNLDAWVTSEGKVYVGNRAIEVLPADALCTCGAAGPDEFGNYDQLEDPECPRHG